MELIPLIYLKKRRLLDAVQGSPLTVHELIERTDKEQVLYFYDLDGIEEDKPNLCTYQRLASQLPMWVDTGPRDLGDIVDAVLAGATTLTLRPTLWPSLQLNNIREITENQLFLERPLKNNSQNPARSYHDADGVVIFPNTPHNERDFKYRTNIKNLSAYIKLYVFLSDPNQISSWEPLGVSGLLIELNKIQEFKKHAL